MIRIDSVIAETILELPRRDTASQPFRVRGTNGKDYMVKPLLNNQPKTLPNELIGTTLATILDLPVPPFALIECTPMLITQLPITSLTPGVYFGSELLQGGIDFRTSREATSRRLLDRINLSNEEDLPGVVAFDNWTLNTDRNNAGNNLLVFQDGETATYYMIDFGHCFTGPNWTVVSLNNVQNQTVPVPMFPLIQNRIQSSKLSFLNLGKI